MYLSLSLSFSIYLSIYLSLSLYIYIHKYIYIYIYIYVYTHMHMLHVVCRQAPGPTQRKFNCTGGKFFVFVCVRRVGAAAPLSHCAIAHDCALVHGQTRGRAKRPKAKSTQRETASILCVICRQRDLTRIRTLQGLYYTILYYTILYHTIV